MFAIVKRAFRNLHWSQWLGLLGLLLLFLALRWNNFDAPLGRDEGEYAYSAQLLIHGLAPYQHAFMQKPPGVIYVYALSDLLAPNVFWFPRVLAAIFVALATLLLGIIARQEFGKDCSLPVMWLATPLILLPGLDQTAASVEAFMLLPLVATVAAYCYSRRQEHKNGHWFAAGFLAGTALLFKYTALPILTFVFVVWLAETARARGKSSLLKAIACATAGGILAAAIELSFFLIHDGGRTFWECTVTFNRYYASSNLFGPAYFWSECKNLWRHWWILFLVPWAVLMRPVPRLWFWLAIFLCAVVSTNGGCYGQYYIVIMPFWAMLNAAGIVALASRISRFAPRFSNWMTALVVLFVMLMVLRPDLRWMLDRREQFAWRKMAQSPFIEAREVAARLSQLSSPNDFVYVAGSEPEILCYAQRFSPTRFITSYALMDPNPLAPGYQREAIGDLQRNPPRFIVFVQVGNSWTRQSASPLEFVNFLGDLLRREYRVIGAYVKNEQNGYWTTNIGAAEFKSASLLLYERKSGQPTIIPAYGTNYTR